MPISFMLRHGCAIVISQIMHNALINAKCYSIDKGSKVILILFIIVYKFKYQLQFLTSQNLVQEYDDGYMMFSSSLDQLNGLCPSRISCQLEGNAGWEFSTMLKANGFRKLLCSYKSLLLFEFSSPFLECK